jgi:hypothetical protein
MLSDEYHPKPYIKHTSSGAQTSENIDPDLEDDIELIE